jgi:hypothetical protein
MLAVTYSTAQVQSPSQFNYFSAGLKQAGRHKYHYQNNHCMWDEVPSTTTLHYTTNYRLLLFSGMRGRKSAA